MLLKKDLDEIDKQIIHMLQEDPNITHSSIAKELDRSQPAIGARIKKLSEQGIISKQVGVNFKVVSDLNLVQVSMMTSKPMEVLEMANVCPFILNAMKISGEYNMAVFMTCTSLKRLDTVVDRQFRDKPYISKIRMDLITGMAQNLILPVNFSVDQFNCSENGCPLYEDCNKITKSDKSITEESA